MSLVKARFRKTRIAASSFKSIQHAHFREKRLQKVGLQLQKYESLKNIDPFVKQNKKVFVKSILLLV